MILKDISFKTPEENILFDDVLLHLAEHQREEEILRFWESPEIFIVLGRIGKIQDDVYIKEAKEKKIKILRRSSGGGTVMQGPGCLNFSFILSKERNPILNDLTKSYHFILGHIISALKELGIRAVFHPASDLALEDNLKKFSGNAQRRGRKFILHHGTILYDFDLDLIKQFLRMPKVIPEYRKDRDHLDFVTNLLNQPSLIKEALQRKFLAFEKEEIRPDEQSCLFTFLKTKEVFIDLEKYS